MSELALREALKHIHDTLTETRTMPGHLVGHSIEWCVDHSRAALATPTTRDDEQFALAGAAQAFCNRGINISCPWEGDLDDEEHERFDALVAAINTYNTLKRTPTEWQDIESAPRDGNVFLAVADGADGRPMHALVHYGCRPHAFSSRHQCTKHPTPECEFEFMGGMAERYGVPFTHWQPLPAPPASRNGEA